MPNKTFWGFRKELCDIFGFPADEVRLIDIAFEADSFIEVSITNYLSITRYISTEESEQIKKIMGEYNITMQQVKGE